MIKFKQFYNIATKVCSTKSATTFGDLPDCLVSDPAGAHLLHDVWLANTLRPRQNGRYFADDFFKVNFLLYFESNFTDVCSNRFILSTNWPHTHKKSLSLLMVELFTDAHMRHSIFRWVKCYSKQLIGLSSSMHENVITTRASNISFSKCLDSSLSKIYHRSRSLKSIGSCLDVFVLLTALESKFISFDCPRVNEI